MAISLANGLKSLSLVLCCLMIGTLIYTISIDGLPFRKDLLTKWMFALFCDTYLNVAVFAVWVFYKEKTNLLAAFLWIILLLCFSGITTCVYVLIQFMKLSPKESAQDPIYHVLMRPEHKNVVQQKRKDSCVLVTKITFSILGCLMSGTWIYTMKIGGFYFLHKEFYTPWMTTLLIDFYVIIILMSVWIVYKESNWLTAFFWIITFLIWGSTCASAYFVKQILRLTSKDPLYLVLLN